MSFDIQDGEFIQIINSGDGHWLAISTIGTEHPEVQVFDSKYSTITSTSKAQIASLLCTSEERITMSIMNVQQQVRLIQLLLLTIMIIM